MINSTLDYKSLELTPSDILKEIGYRKVLPKDNILSIIERLLAEISSYLLPSYTLGIHKGQIRGSAVVLDDCQLETGSIISELLNGSECFCIFAATAGELFQDYQDKIKEKGDILETFILDMIGSCIAEKTGDILEKKLENEIGDYKHTHRFSPGYCGWPLTDQKQIFELLGGNPSGITLSDSCLMVPIKSISGVIGIGKNINEKQYGCQFCKLNTCYKRKDKILYNDVYK